MKESLEKELKELQNSKEIITIRSEGYYDFILDGGLIKANVEEIRVDTEYNDIFVNY